MTPICVKLAKTTQHSLLLQGLFSLLLGDARQKAFPCSQNLNSFTSRAQESFSPINRSASWGGDWGGSQLWRGYWRCYHSGYGSFWSTSIQGGQAKGLTSPQRLPILSLLNAHIISFPHSPHLSSQGMEAIIEPPCWSKISKYPTYVQIHY